jgi:hypothetical protein
MREALERCLDSHCRQRARACGQEGTLRRQVHPVGTPETIVEGLQRSAQAGSHYVTCNIRDASDIEPFS